VTPSEAEDLVLYQVAAVAGVAAAEGVRLQHVKPHGALYTMAARDSALATAIIRAAAAIDRSLVIFGPPGSELLKAAQAAGLPAASEAFADRSYQPNGSLVARTTPGAVLSDAATVVPRAIQIVRHKTVVAVDGSVVPLEADTIGLHGDTTGADDLAARLRSGLEGAGISVRAIREG
jgi:UPF0271 protein